MSEHAAKALYAVVGPPGLSWDECSESSRKVFRAMADAVIESLGLTEETRSTTDPYEVWYGASIVVERRWVSGWSVVGGER